MQKALLHIIIFTAIMVGGVSLAYADEYSSAAFKVLDPVLQPSGYASSGSYQLWSSLSELSVGTSTSAGFGINSGFLFFPEVTVPVVTPTAGDGEVGLSWTASQGFLGWNPSAYTVGQSVTSGGPYSYSSVGNVFSSTRTGLTNGTTYYFIVVVQDAFNNHIGTSTEVSAAPASSGSTSPGGGGGGGGGATYRISKFSVCSTPNGITSDFNGDGRVNLIDLSILLYYLGKPFPYDCNGDNIIDFIDISIMFYHWTD